MSVEKVFFRAERSTCEHCTHTSEYSGLGMKDTPPNGLSIVTLIVLLLIASLVAMVSRRLNLPYSVGLVAAGIAIALLPLGINVVLTRDLIFNIFLPPLIFEAATQLRWQPFRRDLPVTATLAFLGVMISAAVVASGMHWLIGWTWSACALFGVLIAATDPVAVVAAFKELNVERRLSGMIESESLLNDGAAAVGFSLVLTIVGGDSLKLWATAGSLVWTIGGGIGVGFCVTSALLSVAGRTRDHLVEITLTTVIAYGSFLLADYLHASGVLASMTAGLIIGNAGAQRAISDNARSAMLAFWEYAAFLANSVVFILIGIQEAHRGNGILSSASAAAIVLVMIGRAFAVYPICALFSRSALAVDMNHQHIFVWGGLRGALALALVLALPNDVPDREQIITVAFAVVAFSIFVQGLSMPWLIRRMRLPAPTQKT